MSSTDHVAALIEDLEPGSMVLRYVIVAEVLDPSGSRGVWCDSHEDATRWDLYGLLTEALEAERGRHYAEVRDD